MRGVSRASFAELSEQLSAEHITSAPVASRLASELFAVVGLLDTEHGLRRALSDPGKPAAEKGAVAAALLHGKITARAEALVVAAAEAHWATSGDLSDAIEQLAIEAMVIGAESADTLDDLEDELFRFGRILGAEPALRTALEDQGPPDEGKRGLLDTLLAAKVSPAALRLITEAVIYPRGRNLETTLGEYGRLAAAWRERLIAVVRAATELTEDQRARLAAALAQTYGHDVHLNVVVDPRVVGGISVQIGDEFIDGSVASRLAQLRQRLAS